LRSAVALGARLPDDPSRALTGEAFSGNVLAMAFTGGALCKAIIPSRLRSSVVH